MKRRFFHHPSALVESASVGAGTRIWAFAHVLKGAHIGRNCNIGDHCFIEGGARVGHNVTIKNGVMLWEGVTIRDNVFIGPNVIFTNDLAPRSPRLPLVAAKYKTKEWISPTCVETGATVGASATVLGGVRLGRFCMVGAGAVVTKDVPAYAVVTGVPALVRGHVCQCGEHLTFKEGRARCPHCRAKYTFKGNLVIHIHQ